MEDRSKRRRRIALFTRLAGLAVVVALIARHRERVVEAAGILGSCGLGLWLLAALLQLASLAVASVRLSWLVSRLGHRIGVGELIADVVKATALNAAFLMGVGDVYRIRRVDRHVQDVALSSATVVLDRLLGLGTVCAVAAVTSMWLVDSRTELASGWLAGGALAVAAAVVVVIVLRRRGRLTILSRLERPFVVLATRPLALLVALALSLCVVTLWILGLVVVAHGLGVEVPVLALVFSAPLVTIATLLPISVGGIGVRETGYALLLAPYGVTTAQSIALGIAQYSLFLPAIAIGAALLWRDGDARQIKAKSGPDGG